MQRSTSRVFAIYAAISLVPVLALGLVLAANYRAEANRRGLAEGRSEAQLVARTAVAPQLLGHSLSGGLMPSERLNLETMTRAAVAHGDVLRLRVRDLAGHVVFSDDGSGFGQKPEDEALEAAKGHVVARLTRLNSDSNDTGRFGIPSVEVYQPLTVGPSQRRIGVLEMYVPYAPISRDVTAGLHHLYVDLALGLAALYVALFLITASVGRGLRREASLNAFLAEHDTLTNLPNRTLFHRRAARAVARARRRHESVAIAIVDLDRFKDINDTLGHHNGDQLLIELANRLASNMLPGDTVARLGGDEFGLIVRDVGETESVLHRLRAVIDQEVEIGGLSLTAQASVGFVIAPQDGTDVADLLQRADVAMYAAKSGHTGVARYDASLDHYDASSLGLLSELRHAIDDGQLVLHYQPQATLADGTVRSLEALVRWQHPTLGLVGPDRFLPLAEQTDTIDKLTRWVLREALCDLRAMSHIAPDLAVAVNASARSIGRASFAADVLDALTETGIDPERLIVEVTETALLADPDRAAGVLSELVAAGVSISLDDFGQGQTSLAYLAALPIDELKIDRSFVTNMVSNTAHAAIVRSIVDLGHNLSLRVVGEGVETREALDTLRATGCDVAQGYLLARPMPLPEISLWLARTLHTASAA